jgi:putative Mg2+ transporter-C (MgtC) family protein
MEFFVNPQIRIIFQLLLAATLGGIVGLEREYKRKEAGLRTYSLVSLGSALFTIISFQISDSYLGVSGVSFNPSQIIGQIVLGVGFLGAGLIIFRGFHIEGLTTAAGLWIVAAIGAAVGSRIYFPAIFVSFLTLLILIGLGFLEEKFFEDKNKEEPESRGR